MTKCHKKKDIPYNFLLPNRFSTLDFNNRFSTLDFDYNMMIMETNSHDKDLAIAILKKTLINGKI